MQGMESFKIIGVKTSIINQKLVAIYMCIFVFIHFVCISNTQFMKRCTEWKSSRKVTEFYNVKLWS